MTVEQCLPLVHRPLSEWHARQANVRSAKKGVVWGAPGEERRAWRPIALTFRRPW